MPAHVTIENCDGCGACTEVCPVNAITVNGHAKVNNDECVECGACTEACPNGAISLE
ncbi:MAG: 4Fe-4S binding protein [Candidatus Thermoplasmatota archaeon]|nr:4Fe-4S binding protein [Candidatus Thermoplasmatota archaeon]MDI6856144.1 4Fe-4S binding protein [Candidatus Thermoplasmatota archaeon]